LAQGDVRKMRLINGIYLTVLSADKDVNFTAVVDIHGMIIVQNMDTEATDQQLL
jgi:hypothetical protein